LSTTSFIQILIRDIFWAVGSHCIMDQGPVGVISHTDTKFGIPTPSSAACPSSVKESACLVSEVELEVTNFMPIYVFYLHRI